MDFCESVFVLSRTYGVTLGRRRMCVCVCVRWALRGKSAPATVSGRIDRTTVCKPCKIHVARRFYKRALEWFPGEHYAGATGRTEARAARRAEKNRAEKRGARRERGREIQKRKGECALEERKRKGDYPSGQSKG